MIMKMDGLRKDCKRRICQDEQERMAQELQFVCPTCGGHDIIERMEDKRMIRVFEDGEVESSDPDGWDTYNCVYLCADCRSIILNKKLVYFKDRVHLGKWLSQNPEWKLLDKGDVPENKCISMRALVASSVKALRPGELPFDCPECGANKLDECWAVETPIRFYEDGSIQLGRPTYDEDAHHYRCRRCHTVLEKMWGMLIDQETLVDYLKCQLLDPA